MKRLQKLLGFLPANMLQAKSDFFSNAYDFRFGLHMQQYIFKLLVSALSLVGYRFHPSGQ